MAIADEIAELEALLNGATKQVSYDGTSVSFDLEAARRRLAQLKREQDRSRRPRVATIDLSGF